MDDVRKSKSQGGDESNEVLHDEATESVQKQQLYDDEWDKECHRRLKIQIANQAYIEKYLNEPLQKMMVATLNKMPEEPSQFMKDYISLHYFFE